MPPLGPLPGVADEIELSLQVGFSVSIGRKVFVSCIAVNSFVESECLPTLTGDIVGLHDMLFCND